MNRDSIALDTWIRKLDIEIIYESVEAEIWVDRILKKVVIQIEVWC